MGTIWEQIYIFAADKISLIYESFCLPPKDRQEE
jgi:hypothetical protein